MDPLFSLSAAYALAAVFTLAAAHKLLGFARFRAAFLNYGLVPDRPARALAPVVPALELLAAGLLLVPAARMAGAGIAFALLAAYSGAIALNLWRGRTDIDCGCSWGQTAPGLTPWLLIRNASLGLLPLVVLLPVVMGSGRPLHPLDQINAVFAALALAVLSLALDHMAGLRSGVKGGELHDA